MKIFINRFYNNGYLFFEIVEIIFVEELGKRYADTLAERFYRGNFGTFSATFEYVVDSGR